jgi:hypothetical protein
MFFEYSISSQLSKNYPFLRNSRAVKLPFDNMGMRTYWRKNIIGRALFRIMKIFAKDWERAVKFTWSLKGIGAQGS